MTAAQALLSLLPHGLVSWEISTTECATKVILNLHANPAGHTARKMVSNIRLRALFPLFLKNPWITCTHAEIALIMVKLKSNVTKLLSLTKICSPSPSSGVGPLNDVLDDLLASRL